MSREAFFKVAHLTAQAAHFAALAGIGQPTGDDPGDKAHQNRQQDHGIERQRQLIGERPDFHHRGRAVGDGKQHDQQRHDGGDDGVDQFHEK